MAITEPTERVSRLEAAERQLVTAIRLFYSNDDPVSVHTLACAARQIIERECERRGITRFADIAQETFTRKQVFDALNSFRNFFAHGNEEFIDGFSDEANEAVLFVASHDIGVLLGGMPVEARVLSAWFFAVRPEGKDDREELESHLLTMFPDIRTAPRYIQKRMGRDLLEWAAKRPALQVKPA